MSEKVKSKRQKRKSGSMEQRKKISKLKLMIIVLVVVVISGAGTVVGLYFAGYFTIGPPSIPTPTTYSTVTVIDHTSGEVLDALCPVSIQGNKKALTDQSEIYASVNYENVVTEKFPEDINEDLSDYDYVKITTNPDEATDGYWTLNDQIFYIKKVNQKFIIYAFHESTDLYGNVLDRDSGSEWAGATNGNFTCVLWYPTVTKTELHWESGGDWYYNAPWDELSQSTIDKLWNEKYWRCQPKIFDMSVDQADHKKSGEYLLITETSAIKLGFNATVGSSTSATGVNITVESDIDYQVELGAGADSDKIFIVFTETWNTISGNFDFDFEISMGVNITCSNVFAGRVSIPGRYFNDVVPTFTSLQTLV